MTKFRFWDNCRILYIGRKEAALSMKKDQTANIVFILLALLFLLRFLGYAMPSARLWGVNHLIFLPPWVTVVYAVAGAIILAGYYSKSGGKIGESVTGRFNNLFLEDKRQTINRIIFAILCGVIFTVFAMPTHFLGDGYMQINNLGSSHFVIHKWSERGLTYIVSAVQSLLGEKSVANARLAFQTVSVISGMMAVSFMLLMARELGEDKNRRLLAFAGLAGSGVMLLFFGYAESYPLLWVGLTGILYYGLKYINSGRGLWRAVLFFVFGAFIHLYMFVFVPALVGLALSGEKGRRFYAKFKWPFWSVVAIVLIAGAVGLYMEIQNNLAIENIFLRPFAGKPVDESYFVFSVSHVLDLLNLSLVLSPLLIVIIYLVGNGWKKVLDAPAAAFLLLSAGAGVIFLLMIDPHLAMPRDWDLFAPSFIALTMLAITLVPSYRLKMFSGRTALVAFMSVWLVVPYFACNLNEESSVKYHKYIIDLDRKKSISSFIVLRSYYENKGNHRAVDSLNGLYPEYYPDAVRLHRASEALQNRDAATAGTLLAAVKPNKYSPVYHNLMGGLYYLKGDLRQALAESDKALQLEPFNSETRRDRAVIFAGLKMYDSARVWLKSSYRLYDGDPFVLGSLVWLHFQAHEYDSAAYYARHLLTLGGAGVAGNYWLAKLAARQSDRGGFLEYFEAYQRDGSFDQAYAARIKELDKLADSLGLESGRQR